MCLFMLLTWRSLHFSVRVSPFYSYFWYYPSFETWTKKWLWVQQKLTSSSLPGILHPPQQDRATRRVTHCYTIASFHYSDNNNLLSYWRHLSTLRCNLCLISHNTIYNTLLTILSHYATNFKAFSSFTKRKRLISH